MKSSKKQKEFSAADIQAVFEAFEQSGRYSKVTIRKVASGERSNKDILKALRFAKERREKLITRLAKS